MKKLITLIAIFGFLIPSLSLADPAFVQKKWAGAEGASTAYITLPSTTTSGDTFVVNIFDYYNNTFTVTDSSTGCGSPCNTWTTIITQTSSATAAQQTVLYAPNITGGANHTIKVTAGSADYFLATVMEYSGLAASNLVDATNSWNYVQDNGTIVTSTYQSKNITTTNATDLIVGGGGTIALAGTSTPISPWTLAADSHGTSYNSQVEKYQIVSATGTFNASGVWNNANPVSGWVAAFKAASAATTTTAATMVFMWTGGD